MKQREVQLVYTLVSDEHNNEACAFEWSIPILSGACCRKPSRDVAARLFREAVPPRKNIAHKCVLIHGLSSAKGFGCVFW